MNKIGEKIIIGFFIIFAIGCLVLGKLFNENIFYYFSLCSVTLTATCIVKNGMVFDIYKNSKVTKKQKVYSLIALTCYPICAILNIAMSKWIMGIVWALLTIPGFLVQLNAIKKSINN